MSSVHTDWKGSGRPHFLSDNAGRATPAVQSFDVGSVSSGYAVASEVLENEDCSESTEIRALDS